MVRLIQNELRFCLQKKNILIFVLALLSIPLIFPFTFEQDYQKYPTVMIEQHTTEGNNADVSINNIKGQLAAAEESGDEALVQELNQLLSAWQTEKSSVDYLMTLWRNCAKPEVYALLPEQYVLRDENVKNFNEVEGLFFDYETVLRDDERDWQNRMTLNEAYTQRGWLQEANQMVPTGMNVLKEGMGTMGILMVVILLCIMLWNSDMWAGEFDANAYQLLFTLPASRLRIYSMRCAIRVLLSMLAVMVLFGAAYGYALSQYGAGMESLMILNTTALTSFGFFDPSTIGAADAVYTISQVVGLQAILIFAYCFFFIAMVNLVSVLAKNKGLAMMVPGIYLMIIYMILATTVDSSVLTYNPCGYVMTLELLQGNIGIGLPMAFGLLMGLGLLFYLVGYWSVSRDLQGA